MSDVAFGGVAVVALIAFTMPLLLGLSPRLRLPAVVLEIVAGAVVGPGGLGLVRTDPSVEVLATVGLGFLLLLAGLELDLNRLRGPLLVRVVLAYGLRSEERRVGKECRSR